MQIQHSIKYKLSKIEIHSDKETIVDKLNEIVDIINKHRWVIIPEEKDNG